MIIYFSMGKNILHVVNIDFVLPYFIGNQFLFFKERGYSLHVICSQSDKLKGYSSKMGFSYKEIPIKRSFSIKQDISSVISICSYIKKFKIDIVTGHTPKGSLLSMIAAYIMRVPVRIYFRHGLVYETSVGFKRKILIFTDRITSFLSTRIVCVSSSVCVKSIEDKLNPKHKQTLLSRGTCNGIDINRFNVKKIDLHLKSTLRSKLNIPENAFVIGFTGRLVRDKGIVELVKAFELLSNKHENLYLLLVGMLEERDALPLKVRNIILDNSNIIYTGYVDNSEIEYYYSLMDIFVLPSYREGFPTSVLEASSMELPVITTRVTGCVDSIIENKTGMFVSHDTIELSNAIEILITDNSKQKELGYEGRLFVSEYFDQRIIWNCIEELYR